ncbi:hypothetical protein ACFWFX_23220, partial [Streptomyces roseolus]|uniref:hypothetical protein n=1 Tax=Streptomyces roseolus TaxID=67358 RepID=UPI003650A908
MDFLGLRNLTIMDDAVKMVKANKGIDLDLLALPLDDLGGRRRTGRTDGELSGHAAAAPARPAQMPWSEDSARAISRGLKFFSVLV